MQGHRILFEVSWGGRAELESLGTGMALLIFLKGSSDSIMYCVFMKSPMAMVQVRNLRFREVKTLLRFTQLVSSRAGSPSSSHLTAELSPFSQAGLILVPSCSLWL